MFCSINRADSRSTRRSRSITIVELQFSGVLIDWRSVKKLLRKNDTKTVLRQNSQRAFNDDESLSDLAVSHFLQRFRARHLIEFDSLNSIICDFFFSPHRLWNLWNVCCRKKKFVSWERRRSCWGVSSFVGSRSRLGSIELYSPDNRSITSAENVLTSPHHSPVTLCGRLRYNVCTSLDSWMENLYQLSLSVFRRASTMSH